MGMQHGSLIDKINPTSIALTATAIHHFLLASITGKFRVPPEFEPQGGVQRTCDTGNIDQAVNNACTNVIRHLDKDFHSSSTEVRAKKIDNICSLSRRRINSTGTDPAMAQPHNDKGRFYMGFFD